MTRRMAFSWTCQPKRNEAYAQRVKVATKLSQVGWRKSLARAGLSWLVSLKLGKGKGWVRTYDLRGKSHEESCARRNIGEDSEGGVADQTSGHAVHRVAVDG